MILYCDPSAFIELYLTEAGSPEPVAFACFDARLNKAAKVLAMETPFAV